LNGDGQKWHFGRIFWLAAEVAKKATPEFEISLSQNWCLQETWFEPIKLV
jgi:hypothetical protein